MADKGNDDVPQNGRHSYMQVHMFIVVNKNDATKTDGVTRETITHRRHHVRN